MSLHYRWKAQYEMSIKKVLIECKGQMNIARVVPHPSL